MINGDIMSKIKKDMKIGEVVEKYPEAAMVMIRSGLHCAGCGAAFFETVEQGARAHGMDDKQIKKMLEEMEKAIKKK